MTTLPKWYMPISIIALIWNLLGCFAFLSDVMMTADDISRLTTSQQELYASRPMWAVIAYAIAVWGGAAGSLGLILRHRWAMQMFVASLVGLIVQDFGLFFLTKVATIVGPAAFFIQGSVLLIAIGLLVLALKALKRNWIPKQVAQK
jgi:hypothetical protein